MITVDASVAVKWFLPEPGAKAAKALLGGSEPLIAPALIRLEVAAAITRKTRMGELSPEDSQATCDIWLRALANGVLALSRDESDLVAAIKLAIEIKHPLQDCLYLALAQRRESVLITADAKFGERAGNLYPKVELLHMG